MTVEKEIRIGFGRQRLSVPDFYSALLGLSGGPDRRLWPTRLAIQSVVEHVGVEAKAASPASLRVLWVRLNERVAELVLRPIARSKAVHGPLRQAWRQGSRSHWDNLVGDLMYDPIDNLPGIDSLVENGLIPELKSRVIPAARNADAFLSGHAARAAARVRACQRSKLPTAGIMQEISVQGRPILYEKIRRDLDQGRPIGLKKTGASKAMDVDMIAKTTDDASKTVRGVSRHSGSAR